MATVKKVKKTTAKVKAVKKSTSARKSKKAEMGLTANTEASSEITSRPPTSQRMKSGNSNGFSMSNWYGGNNKHRCRTTGRCGKKTSKRLLRY